ncbi:hypothetical protein ANN_00302 [Periplaneta americana]|uniref:Uncharacterized protein n=1 Tax=Periplaneta americana TaxID=6978 RepID=A0ABQ8TTB0_PERAM|nr:hypothetical protein ANN_00302 [Periplaneta americana]
MEALRNQNEARKFYREVNNIRRPFNCKNTLVKDEQGQIISEDKEICERWRRYFDGILNVSNPQENVSSEEHQECELHDNQNPPTIEEIRIALNKLKNNKAPGTDNIPAELFKRGGVKLEQQLLDIVDSVWIQEKMPQQ